MFKKILALTLTVILALGLMAGCTTSNQASSGAAAAEPAAQSGPASTSAAEASTEGILPGPFEKDLPLNIAYVPAAMNTYYQLVLAGINEEVERKGGSDFAEVTVYSPVNEQKIVEEHIGIFETLLQDDTLDAIFFSTHNDEAMIPYLKQFAEKGVPVFLFNMPKQDVTNQYYVSLVSYDFYNASKLVGEWAVDYFDGQDVKMLYLEGIEGSHNTIRKEGFLSALEGHDNFEIVASQNANWTREGGQSVTENVLQSNPEINFIYGPYDEMPLGAIVALKDAGRLDDIVVAGYDLTEDGYHSIVKGELSASVNTDPKLMGNNLITTTEQYCVLGQEVPKEVLSELVVYDSTNIGQIDPNLNY